MSLKRFIVNIGEKTSSFFAHDLQNIYYKRFFLSGFKAKVKKHSYSVDHKLQKAYISWWRERTGLQVNPCWHDFYSSVNGICDIRYIPENIYYAYLEPFFNKKSYMPAIDDKSYYSERFVGVKHTEFIVRNINGFYFDNNFQMLSLEKAAELCQNAGDGIFIKYSSGTGGGALITYLPSPADSSVQELKDLLSRYQKNFVIEKIIHQCQETAELNPSSVNTIRFITFLDSDGVHLLSAVIRIGGAGSYVDNYCSGGIAAGIHPETGIIKNVAYDQSYRSYSVHPNGNEFAGKCIPSYHEAFNMVANLHLKFAHFRIISWDIAIDENHEPLILEFNITPQSIDFHQINNGPLFGDITEKILNEVFKR